MVCLAASPHLYAIVQVPLAPVPHHLREAISSRLARTLCAAHGDA
jgi:hypothetical protein